VPVVSVVTVFHQRSPHFAAAVASVCAQTLPDWELVLVDNGTGLDRAVLEPEAATDARIRVVSLPANEGIARGINAGVDAARGEFIALLDYDDVMLPRRLERQVGLLRSDAQLGLVNCGVDTIDDDGRVIGREFGILSGDAQKIFSGYFAGTIAVAYTGRREVFRQFAHRQDFTWASDFDFFARVSEHWKLGGVPEVLQQYRRYPAQTTNRHRDEQVLEECAVRLMSARRRAGRDEGLAAAMEELRDLKAGTLTAAQGYLHFARRALAQELVAPAVYQARRAIVMQRDPITFCRALGVLLRAILAAPGRTWFLGRLFFTGPLRTHGLRDEGASLAGAH
jgi:glycosyltransferase involved in cell wall biosynthesis